MNDSYFAKLVHRRHRPSAAATGRVALSHSAKELIPTSRERALYDIRATWDGEMRRWFPSPNSSGWRHSVLANADRQ